MSGDDFEVVDGTDKGTNVNQFEIRKVRSQ